MYLRIRDASAGRPSPPKYDVCVGIGIPARQWSSVDMTMPPQSPLVLNTKGVPGRMLLLKELRKWYPSRAGSNPSFGIRVSVFVEPRNRRHISGDRCQPSD